MGVLHGGVLFRRFLVGWILGWAVDEWKNK